MESTPFTKLYLVHERHEKGMHGCGLKKKSNHKVDLYTMAGGRPKKRSKNLSGLHNQQPQSRELRDDSEDVPGIGESGQQECHDEEIRGWDETYGLKMNFEEEYEGDCTTYGSDIDEEGELEHLDDEDFGQRLADMVQREDDVDVDWIPEQL